jgi:hypothetical protein
VLLSLVIVASVGELCLVLLGFTLPFFWFAVASAVLCRRFRYAPRVAGRIYKMAETKKNLGWISVSAPALA